MAKEPKEAPPEIAFHPRTTREVIGHERIEKMLLGEFENETLPGAYLLTGPRGIGKASMAYRFARFLLNQGKSAAVDEGPGLFGDLLPPIAPAELTGFSIPEDSTVYSRVAASSHGDLLVLEPLYDEKKHVYKSDIQVDAAKSVGNFLSMTAVDGIWKVVIIDAVEQMNHQAQNAILKRLEEPPAHTILLLISHNPGKLLATIRSRCRRVTFTPPAKDEFSTIVSRLLPDCPEEEVSQLYYLSGGSPGLAVTLHVQGAVDCYDAMLDAAQAESKDGPAYFSLADKFAADKGGDALAWSSFSIIYERIITQLASLASGGEGDRRLAPVAARKPLGHWLNVWDKASELLKDTEQLYLDRRHTFVVLMATLAGQLDITTRR